MSDKFWLDRATRFSFPRDVTIEARNQRDKSTMWIVSNGSAVLNSEGEWEWEPSPSNRTDDFIERTRMKTKEEALDRYRAFVLATAEVKK